MSGEVKWIKITTDMFDDEKIRIIEKMPDGDSILIIWIKLLTLAGRINAGGYILLTESIPYTNETLAIIFDRPLMTVQLALKTFEEFRMLHFQNGVAVISNWDKHQNVEGLQKIRELTRAKVARYRNRLQLVGGDSYRVHTSMVMARDKSRCVYCGSEDNLVIDHLIPLLLGGDNEPDNLVAACRKCNSGKAGKLFEDTGYEFLNPKMYHTYEKVKERLKVTRPDDVTLRNPTEVEIDNKIKTKNKDIYGEFNNVLLTDTEYKKLVDKFGDDGTKTRIENLSLGISSKGYKYKSHYATILNWERMERGKGETSKRVTANRPARAEDFSDPGALAERERIDRQYNP